jgi:hypothetical protein
VARGAAAADYDGDGDLDLLVTTSGGPARLLRNDSVTGARSIRIALAGGAGSNPQGYGAKVEVTSGGRTRTAWARAAHSYASQSECILTFGLGDAGSAEQVVVHWPSGKTSTLTDVPAGSRPTIREADAS